MPRPKTVTAPDPTPVAALKASSTPRVLLDVNTACVAICCTRPQLYHLMNTGEIKYINLGPKSRRIPVASIDAWVQAKLKEQNDDGHAA